MSGSEAGGGERAREDWARMAALVIADGLSSHHLDVGSPGWDGAQLLKVTNVPGTLCYISVAADGAVEWEHWPCEGRQADPACTAAMVLGILGADDASTVAVPAAGCRCSVSFTGVAGRILVGCGLRVVVRAYPDQEALEVYSDIEVTSPDRPERGTVRVAGDGSLAWCCRARVAPEDEGALDLAEVAGIIARALTGTDRPGAWPPHGRHRPAGDLAAGVAARPAWPVPPPQAATFLNDLQEADLNDPARARLGRRLRAVECGRGDQPS